MVAAKTESAKIVNVAEKAYPPVSAPVNVNKSSAIPNIVYSRFKPYTKHKHDLKRTHSGQEFVKHSIDLTEQLSHNPVNASPFIPILSYTCGFQLKNHQ